MVADKLPSSSATEAYSAHITDRARHVKPGNSQALNELHMSLREYQSDRLAWRCAQSSEHDEETKSGVETNFNAKAVRRLCLPAPPDKSLMSVHQRDAYFDIGDDVKMTVVCQEPNGDRYHESQYFTIREKQTNARGHWEYQLNDKTTGEDHEGDTWFSEDDLTDA
ncbi:hypothetical protein BDV95DRAFT_601827 [Massariosphaeria phaeospora]|uniref:Uncharacterized protein n=1 Tax=Massariosphaeria phaeospora TaxID=100035 RepID=A0A7C8IE78_9PLEO|nr:hypothetical protein BDV95DRAFT_601827 [Massariosphaeria phaeospora]